jgi:hypothetical protein
MTKMPRHGNGGAEGTIFQTEQARIGAPPQLRQALLTDFCERTPQFHRGAP